MCSHLTFKSLNKFSCLNGKVGMGRCSPPLLIIFESKLNEVRGNLERAQPLFY